MSRIFSWDELSQGRIPSNEDFSAAEAECRQRLSEIPWISGGVFFGSSQSHTLGPCSDLDVLAAYPDDIELPPIRGALKGLQAEMLAKYRVPVSFSLCDLVRARSGEHRLPVGMVKHLAWAAARDGVFGQNPLPDILVRDSPAARRDAARQYVKYAEAAVNGHQPDAYNMSVLHAAQPTELSCALDTPFHAVRRLLEHLFPRSTAAGLSKTELLASVEESELVAIHQCLRTILGFLKIYQNLLAQESLPTAKAYETFLRSWEPRLICNARRCLSAVTRSI